MTRDRAPAGPWLAVGAASVVILTTFEASLLELGRGYFSSGYNAAYLDSPGLIAGFLALSLIADLALVGALWLAALLPARWLSLGRLQRLCLAAYLGLAIPIGLDSARYLLQSLLGRITDLPLLYDLAGRSVGEMIAQALAQVPSVGWLALFVLLGAGPVAWLAGRLERRVAWQLEPPRARVLAAFTLAAVALVALVLLPGSGHFGRIQFGLEQKTSAILIRALLAPLSDFDRDGSGLYSRPRDPAPFDARVHYYALDLPGNGLDEDRLAGDHPPGFPVLRSVPVGTPAGGARPDVVLVFLEGFRADLLGASLRGRPITPVLDRLAREGARSDRAFVHTPYTATSRAELFAGTLLPRPGEPTLIDDFRALGYRVAYYSGQNDSFGDSDVLVGVERADAFYDARQDVERRVGRGASRAALQVSWKLLNERVREQLDRVDPEQPLFLYVNYSDTHFPYHHAELERLLDVEPLEREAIRIQQRERVWETYANAAANVDRAIGELLEAVRERRGGRHLVVLVASDHGEAFYERGYLGHGQALDEIQTRTPFVVAGIGGQWPEPLGLADVRGLLLANLHEARPGARPRFVPDSGRQLFQFRGRFERPRLIGLRSLDGLAVYDFPTERFDVLDAAEAERVLDDEQRRAELESLVRSWEAWRLESDAP